MTDLTTSPESIGDMPLLLRVEVGRARIPLAELSGLGEGSLVELEKPPGGSVEVYVNERMAGRGEVLVLDGRLCVRMTQVLSPGGCLPLRVGS